MAKRTSYHKGRAPVNVTDSHRTIVNLQPVAGKIPKEQESPHKSVAGLNTTTASAYLFATTTHVALFSTFFHPVNLSQTAHMSVRKRQSVLALLTGFHWFFLAKFVSPKSCRWHGGMKLKSRGRSGLRVHLLECRSKQPGDLALRADWNSAMPGDVRWSGSRWSIVRSEER